MKRDISFLVCVVGAVLVLFIGIFVRGIKDISIVENRTLSDFPKPTINTIIDTSFQKEVENALSDQLLFGGSLKSIYNKVKNQNVIVMVSVLKAGNKINLDELDSNNITSITNTASSVKTQQISQINDQTAKSNLLNENQKPETEKVIIEVLGPSLREPEYMTFNIALTPRVNGFIEIDESHHLIFPSNTVPQPHEYIITKANNMNELVKNYPGLNFYSYYIETDIDTEFVKGAISHFIVNPFFELLDPKIKKTALYVNSPSDYQNFFYKTDHHWDVQGQLQGYQDIIHLTKGFDETLLDIKEVLIEGLKYNGYKSRKCDDYEIYDDFKILIADLPKHKEYVNDKEQPYDKKEEYLRGEYTRVEGVSYYGNCNGADYGLVEYDYDQPEKDNILIFVDSFSNPINSFIASHYNRTYIVDFRFYKEAYGKDFDFGSFVEENQISDVLFMGYYLFYANDTFLVTD